MGSHPAKALIALLALSVSPAMALEPGWHYSPLPGEGDRAALGCDRDATAENYTCLAVRCEDDYTTGIHIHTSRSDPVGTWEMTLDRENARLVVVPSDGPYDGRFMERAEFLLDRIEQGTFIYLRPAGDNTGAFSYIDLGGSLFAINAALAFCAPRVPVEPNAAAGV